MAVGLPGTGVGGLFFILSAFFMVVVELHRTIRGRSSLARWRIVGRQAGIAAAMVVAVTVALWLLHQLLFPSTAAGGKGSGSTPATDQLVPFAPVLITLAVLAALLVTAYLAKFVFGESGSVRQVAEHPKRRRRGHSTPQLGPSNGSP
jgi:protein-S-isoprenylcysteine O-methyltransferase Ste14